jgi:serine kinase of HPr protein (carbohydrate metabolism regulator)
MRPGELSSETVHATAVAMNGRAVLIAGRSGAGKSDLALRLIDRGAVLVSDDQTMTLRRDGKLLASAPANLAGKMEVRGLGILEMDHLSDVEVVLVVSVDGAVERMPLAPTERRIAGVSVPMVTLAALEPSAPIKVEMALKRLGAGK